MTNQFKCYMCGDPLTLEELDKEKGQFTCSTCGKIIVVSKTHKQKLGVKQDSLTLKTKKRKGK